MKQLKTPFKRTIFLAKDVPINMLIDTIVMYETSAKERVPFTGRYRLVKKGIELELGKSWIIKRKIECKRVRFGFVEGD